MSNNGIDSLYVYVPNNIAPAIFAVAFFLLGLVHLWQCFRYKSWKWTCLYPLCCFMFAIGFALREYGAFHYEITRPNLDVYIASTCFIYMSPPLLELANYHILGRILYYIPYLSPIHPGRVLTTFGLLSSVVEALNAIGVSYSANTYLPERYINLGHALMKASLIVQLVVITLFLILASVFTYRCHRDGVLVHKVLTPLCTLYASMALILARTVYRTVEYFALSDISTSSVDNINDLSPLLKYEWYFWVFEAALMLLNSIMWNIWHPGRYLPQNKLIHLAEDGVTEIQGTKSRDERNYLITVLDPFGWFVGGQKNEKKEVTV